jgi:anti-sigma factor RsiW
MNPHPLALDTLVAYWLGETDADTTLAIDEHLLGCDACGARLDEVIALGDGVRRAFDAGRVRAFVGAAFVERLAARGAKVREYRLRPGDAVACSVAADDDVLVTRLDVPLAGVTRLDAIVRSSLAAQDERIADIPFDAARGQVLMLPRMAEVRRAPAHTFEVALVAVDGEADRVVARYTFEHAPTRP